MTGRNMEPEDVAAQASAFFTHAANTKPFMKLGAQGFAGTGKTYTLALIAVELVKSVRAKDPNAPARVVMVDTEKAAGFLRPIFQREGIELMVRETRSLGDFLIAVDLCEQGYAPVMLLDSLSHVWEGFVESYKREKKRTRLEIQDWGVLKPMWKGKFSDRFVRSKVHILFTGRAGYEYETTAVQRDDGSFKKEINKSGIKMKVEGETAYEPDVLVHMERFETLLDDHNVKQVWRECTVLKDRSGLLDGKTIKNPTGSDFLPVISYMLDTPLEPVIESAEGDDRALFEESDEVESNKRKRQVLLEEIEGTIQQIAPSNTAADKATRLELFVSIFRTRSWTQITMMRLDDLRAGQAALEARLFAIISARETAAKEGLDAEAQPNGVETTQ